MVLSRAYQVYSRLLNRHQMTLITNLVITNYRSQGMINLLALWNNMINPWPKCLFSHSVCALLHHPVTKWLMTLKQIQYKIDTVCWFHILSTRYNPLTIEEYVPKGLLLKALFLLNN